MNNVTLKNDGQMLLNGRPVKNRPLMCLNHSLGIAEDCTFRSYFRLIEQYPPLAELSPFFPGYLKEYRDAPEERCICEDFDYLELSKTVEMIGFPGKPRLEIYIALHGICEEGTCDMRHQSLFNLLDMPLKLGRLKHIIFGDRVDVFEFETVFTLFEFIDGIAWELGFHSVPMTCTVNPKEVSHV